MLKLSCLSKLFAITFFSAAALFAQITSMTYHSPNDGPIITAGESGSAGFVMPTFTGNPDGDLSHWVREDGGQWVRIDNNPASGWVYNENWGHWWDNGFNGIWIIVEQTTEFRLQSIRNPNVRLDFTITYNHAPRDGFALSFHEGNGILTADNDGNLGFVFPRVGGTAARERDWGMFVIQIEISGVWQPITDPNLSTFYYQSSGYNDFSDRNQYAQWWGGGLSGLWFRPVTQNYRLRIGYPQNGQAGGSIGNNWIIYEFIGNPNAPRPDPSELGEITVSDLSDPNSIDGWTLIFNDEFNGDKLNSDKWTMDYGFFLDENEPGTGGWGNGEAQHYTRDAKNVFVSDGNLNLVAHSNDPKDFPHNARPQYSSGKVITKDKFYFTYGRIDFRIKLPTISGTWPAAWMMPQYDVYGGWAASGEIDVMEAMGRNPGQSSGAIHFGGAWPENTYAHGEYNFPQGQTIDQFNVYSVVWRQDRIIWYVNGNPFFMTPNTRWHSIPSSGAQNNDYAPFDQHFYLILNLAVGGWFDPVGTGQLNPDHFPATMQIDYVRVWQTDENGKHGGTWNGQTENPTGLASSPKRLSDAPAFRGIRNGQVNLVLPSGQFTVELYNLQGRLLRRASVNATSGVNAVNLKTEQLSRGVFFINVKNASGNSVLRQKISLR